MCHFKESSKDDVVRQLNGFDRLYRVGGIKVLTPTLKGFNMLIHMIMLLSDIEYECR